MSQAISKRHIRFNRRFASALVVLWMAITPGWVNALPSGGEIVSGTGSIDQSAQDMVIQQDSQQLITNWQGFSIDEAESVTFLQPNSSAVALNRVIGSDPSIILGKLSANGQVFLTNPSGVVFGKNAVVDVHGLLATTLGISNEDFLKGNYQFSQDPDQSLAAVINSGTINAGSYVGLAAPTVENNGSIIVADLGSVALASGTAATLDFNGDGLISFTVTGEVSGVVTDSEGNVLSDRINNSGFIRANGGQVLLTARSASNVIGDVINHSGIIEAQTVQQKDGKIILSGGGQGNIGLSGTLDAALVQISAGSDRNGTGAVMVAKGESLTTNNGDIQIVADDLILEGDLNSGTGNVFFILAGGGTLILSPDGGNGAHIGDNDLSHIIAQNLTLGTSGNINIQGLTEGSTRGITDTVFLVSGKNINFNGETSFPAVNVSAVTDINVRANITTTRGDFVAVADSEGNGAGDFNVAPGAVITSARDIDISAPNINADESSFNETRNLVLNGNTVTPGPTPATFDAGSLQRGSLSSFLTDFFENGGPDGC